MKTSENFWCTEVEHWNKMSYFLIAGPKCRVMCSGIFITAGLIQFRLK